MNVVFINNKFVNSDEASIGIENRSFRYGDGLFESCLLFRNNVPLIELHVKRLLHGMRILGISLPLTWNAKYFAKIISELAEKNKIVNGRVRINVWREGNGFYLPEKNEAGLLVTVKGNHFDRFTMNDPGLNLGLYPDYYKPIHPLSYCKTTSALPYVLAAKYAEHSGLDDVVLMNTGETIADSLNSNIWLVKNNVLYTTIDESGGVHGVMQHFILSHAAKWKFELERIDMTAGEMLSADECFLTNAVQGIRWVKKFQYAEFTNRMTKKVLVKLNEELFGKKGK